MIVKLLTEHHLEFLSLKGSCRGSSESTHVKMPHCLKSHALAQLSFSAQLLISPLSHAKTQSHMGPLVLETFGDLFLNAPIATKVDCFSRLLKCLRSLHGKQCGPRAVCSGSTLFASILN